MTPTIDQARIKHFMDTFFGYGDFARSTWFIGMEEGGCSNLQEFRERLETWEKLDRKPLVDVKKYHLELQKVQKDQHGTLRFGDKPAIQKTWGRLIRLYLAAYGAPVDTETVRSFQRDNLNSDLTLLELLPLPAPSIGHWFYKETGIPDLKTRGSYREAFANKRGQALHDLVHLHRPKAVVFYGLSYAEYWKAIVGVDSFCSADVDGQEYLYTKSGDTNFLILKHPAARLMSNAYFETIGQRLRE